MLRMTKDNGASSENIKPPHCISKKGESFISSEIEFVLTLLKYRLVCSDLSIITVRTICFDSRNQNADVILHVDNQIS